MVRLLIAVVVGIVLAVAGSVLAANSLTQVANGTPSNTSLYQYGNR